MKTSLHVSIGLSIVLGLSGCDATVELTKAPFDATTHLTNGTTNATSEFTQPLKEFTSSTTPGSSARIVQTAWSMGNGRAGQ